MDDTEGRPQYALMTTFMTNISKAMSDEKVMLLIGHKAWRSCYDQRNPETGHKKAQDDVTSMCSEHLMLVLS